MHNSPVFASRSGLHVNKDTMFERPVLVRCSSRDAVKENSLVFGDLSHVFLRIGSVNVQNKIQSAIRTVALARLT
jgi:hypothetical protein